MSLLLLDDLLGQLQLGKVSGCLGLGGRERRRGCTIQQEKWKKGRERRRGKAKKGEIGGWGKGEERGEEVKEKKRESSIICQLHMVHVHKGSST